MPKIVTMQQLRGADACRGALEAFGALFGASAEATPENCLKAARADLDFVWARGLLPGPLWAEYDAKVEPLWAEYDAKAKPLWAEYDAKVEPLRAEYDAKVALVWCELYNRED